MKKLFQSQNCIEKHLLFGFFVIFITCFSSVLYGQTPQTAPLNPEYIKYMSGLNQPQLENDGGHIMGLIPSPILPHFSKINKNVLKSGNFASKYDLRTAGPGGTSLLTSVKDQGSCGACWAFAALGSIEGFSKKTGNGEYDLSENNLKECHGFTISACSGGSDNMVTAYLARQAGPVSELNDPYNENEIGCKENTHPEFWVTDVRHIPKDPNIIKQAVLDYGALYTTMYMNQTNCYNSSDYTYYSSSNSGTNHAVLLVGWDDTKVTAGGTGAWIIKNSWGTYWGESGFFYISYNDPNVNSDVTSFQNIKNRVINSTLFGYDKLGMMGGSGYGSDIGYGLIRFSPGNKNYSLKQLSTYMPSGPGTVRFEVYDDFNGTTLSNLLGTITEKACELPGYYTFNLPTPIQINANNDFYIKVCYNTLDYSCPIPLEIGTQVSTQSGKCWISPNGASWQAIGSNTFDDADLCIKAYGEYAACTPPTSPATLFSISAITENSMTVGWTRGNGNSVLVLARAGSAVNASPESESAYTANSAFGSGSQIGVGNFVIYNGPSTSVNLTALTSGTAYYYAIFEYNIASNCYLSTALTGNATTTGIPPYCTAGATDNSIGYISRVRLNTIDQSSGWGTAGYEDYTSKIATMQIGVNSTITINRSSAYLKDSVLIYVDWNKDGDFSDVGEKVYSSTSAANSYTANFAPPSGATIGTTRMRIRLHNSTYLPNSTPCGNSYYGEVEDYSINVTAACVPPTTKATTFTSSALTNNSMTLGWTRGNGNSVIVVARAGGAVNSDPESGSAYTANTAFGSGTQIGTGNYVVYNGSTTSVNLTALLSGTAYYYAIYEYNTASNCYLKPALTGNATTTGTSICAAGSNQCDEYISNVTFGTINNSSTCSTGGYTDYSSISTDIVRGSSLVISVTNGLPYTADRCGIWVDWNNNGDFSDDQAITVTGSPGVGPYSATIICPSDASTGLKRIRIRIHYNDETTAPCGNTVYGEVEDYTINVIAACTPPTAPTIGPITQPTCAIATGSVVINGLPATGIWVLTRTPGGTTTTGTGTSATITGLAIGTYSYIVANASGCNSLTSSNVVINAQPATPTAPTAGTITQPTCALATGSVVLNGLPATGTWTITRTPGEITSTGTGLSTTISGIDAGTITFKVTNVSGCSSLASEYIIINTQPLTPTAPTVGTITHPTCTLSTGGVVLNGLPGTGTWTLTRTPGGTTTTGTGISSTITGLATGTYTYIITNASGCNSIASANVVINAQPATPTAPTVGTITQPTCVLATGGVVLNGLPATGTWTLTKTPGGTTTTGTGTSTTITGLAVGPYTYIITNASGCNSVASPNVIINAQPSTPTAPTVGTITQPTCALATGSVVLSGLPATGTWTLTKTPGGTTTTGTGTSITISGLAAGTYTYTLTNASGCTSVASANVVLNAFTTTPTTPTVGTITHPTCVLATGGVVLNGLPATGAWTLTRTLGGTTTTGTGTSTTITGLAAGTYTYIVTNASGCNSVASANVVINAQPATPTAPTVGTITQPTCTLATGGVVLNGLPATGTWTLTRTPGGTTTTGTGTSTTITGLAPGTYTYTVTNASGCNSVASANVVISAQPTTPTAPTIGTITQPTCVLATGGVVLNGLPATGAWTLTRTLGGTTTTGTGTSTTISGLTAGTYTYIVTNASGCNSVASANVVINAQPATPTAPTVGTITQPTCTLATGGVLLNGLPATGTWTLTRTPGGITTTGTGTSSAITGLATGTYTFIVTNASGCNSVASANVVINAQPATPTAPISNDATSISKTSFTANWNTSPTAAGYRVDVATDIGFATLVVGFNNIDVSNVTNFGITGLVANTSYYYRVRAYNLCGTSQNSVVITTTTLPDPPAAPTANPATSIVQTSLTANWSNSATASGYRLDVAADIGFTSFVAGFNNKDVSDVTSYSVTGIIQNTTYYYRLRAYNTGGTSPNSGVITTTTLPDPPDAPAANPATSIVQTSLTANWSTSATATGYRLDVATNVGFTSFVSGFNDKDVSNVTSFSVTSLTANTTYYYRIRAYNTGGISPNSGVITTITLPDPPAAPIANPATNIVQTSFTANWNTSATATGYRLDVATNVGFTAFVAGFNNKDVSNVTSYIVTGLIQNTTYYYRLRAYNTGGTSPNSGLITTTTLPDPPAAPTANPATSIVQTSLTANWSTSATATGYRLDVATNVGFTAFVTGFNDKDVSNVASYSVTGLSANTPYYYRLRAYNTGGASPNSGTITTTTLPNPPAAPTSKPTTNLSQTGFTANWNASASATGYRFDVATNSAFTSFVVGFNDKDVSNVTILNVTGLSAITQYYYRLRGYNTGGIGANSIPLTVTTLTNPPAAPIGLTASSCNNLVTLNWRKNSDPYFIRYHIYGGLTNNPTAKIDSTSDAISDTTKIISGLTSGQTYYFRVTAVNYDGPESPFSNQSSAIVKTGVIPKIKVKFGDLLICYNLGDSIASYQWFNGNTIIPSAIGQYYTSNKQLGSYSVETIDKNGCKNSSKSVSILSTKSLTLFPNPASVSFSLNLIDVSGSNDASDEKALVSMFNSSGVKVLEFQAINLNDELLKAISVSHLDNGVYVVKVLLNQKDLYYTKIVVLK